MLPEFNKGFTILSELIHYLGFIRRNSGQSPESRHNSMDFR